MSQELIQKAEDRQEMITQGPLHKAFFILAGPAVAAMSADFILHLTDMIWVGRIGGAVPVAIVTSSMFSLWIIWSLMTFLTVGTVAVASRYYGAKDFNQSGYVASQAIVYGLYLATAITILGIWLAPVAFVIMGSSEAVSAGGIDYLRIQFAGSLFFVLGNVISSIFRATGDTKTPMKVALAVIATNIILDPILIFGWGPIPRLETSGAALATIISVALGLCLHIYYVKHNKLTIKISLGNIFKPDHKVAWKLIRIGLPLSIANVLFSLVYFFLNRIASQFGDATVAALGIGNRCESIAYLICFGASTATSAMVGQNLGANKPDRAEKAGWVSLLYTGMFTVLITVLFLTIPHLLARVFTSDPEVIAIVKSYLIIIGISQIFMAAEIVLEGAFSGAGDTLPPTLIGTFWSLLRIPLAYYLCFTLDLGPSGIWYAVSSTCIIKGIMMTIWFKRGKWKLKNV